MIYWPFFVISVFCSASDYLFAKRKHYDYGTTISYKKLVFKFVFYNFILLLLFLAISYYKVVFFLNEKNDVKNFRSELKGSWVEVDRNNKGKYINGYNKKKLTIYKYFIRGNTYLPYTYEPIYRKEMTGIWPYKIVGWYIKIEIFTSQDKYHRVLYLNNDTLKLSSALDQTNSPTTDWILYTK